MIRILLVKCKSELWIWDLAHPDPVLELQICYWWVVLPFHKFFCLRFFFLLLAMIVAEFGVFFAGTFDEFFSSGLEKGIEFDGFFFQNFDGLKE